MALTPSFTISQTALNPALVYATDTSTGSDAAVTARRITFTDANGNTLVTSGTTTSYNAWALVDTTGTFNVLTQDYAVSILVQWVNVSGTVLYSSTQSYCLAYFNKQFMYYLTQLESLNPTIVQDANYYANKAKFWTTIVGAVNAVEFGSDIAASQNELNVGTEMRLNESKYF